MSPDTSPLVDVTDIIQLVGHPSFQRGRDYARQGAVLETQWDADSRVLRGTVLGGAPMPYRCSIRMVPARGGFKRPTSSSCSCPMDANCKHVAATLLESNSQHVRQLELAAPMPSRADAAPEPTWKTLVSALTGAAPEPPPPSTEAAHKSGTALGLLFELREQTPRSGARWHGPSAKPAGKVMSPGAKFRLGVRPVIRSPTGNWVRANVTWNSLGSQANRLGLDSEQHRWFAQFAALHRSTRGMFGIQEADWLYLDDFRSPLLWNLFEQADALRIALVGGRKDALVTVGKTATVSIDASTLRPAPGAQATRVTTATQGAASSLQLATVLTIDGHPHPTASAGLLGNHGIYAFTLASRVTITLAPTPQPLTTEQRRLLAQQVVTVPAGDVKEFLADYYPRLRRTVTVTSADASVQFPEIVLPTLVLTATFAPEHLLELEWEWEYDGTRMPLQAGDLDGTDSRDLEFEHRVITRVERLVGVDELAASATLRGPDAAEFSAVVLPDLQNLVSVRVDVNGSRPDYRELTDPPKLTFTTVETDQRDWFDLGVLVSIDGRKVPFGPLFTALSKGQKKLLLVDNSYLSLRHPAFEELRRLIEEASALAEWETGPRISRYQASLWAEFEDLADETVQARTWRDAARGLLDTERIDATPLPAGVRATLRPYQQDGFNWLAFLYAHQLGGILADDMGLGKTLQALALVAHAFRDANVAAPAEGTEATSRPPFLVVAPTSVVPNWLSEAERFTPDLVVRGITTTEGKGRQTLRELAAGAHIVVTSYALFRLDFGAYQAIDWAGLILDEAQFVKNHASKAHQCAVDLRAPFKLAITGTPMENSLMDLWALFAIVAPGLFPSGRRFTEEYVRPIGRGEAPELVAKLRRRIRPLMMRRTKDLVATELPAKQEQVLRIDLAPRHRKLYDTFLQRERQKLLGLLEDLDRNRFIVFRSLTLLRMLSLDASLVDDKYADIPSSKLDALFEQLDDVVAEGHRALIFSQFTSFLGKAAARLENAGIAYEYLDGSTLRRASVISRFKGGDAPVFLISLKAGGFGLNLTEADYVFLLDPWWNPATESQAVDRTHRIGQTRSVNVYRLVASGTIEEKVMALRDRKAELFDAVMDDDAVFSSALTADDIRGLLDG